MFKGRKLSPGKVTSLLLASLLFSASCLADGSPAVDSRRALGKDYRVSGIAKRVAGDKIDEQLCASFSLSEKAIRRFLERARPTDRREVHDRFDWLPCIVTASLEGKTLSARLELNASGVAELTPKGGETELLVCETACEDLLSGR